jgi:hypothetical protein
VSLEQQEAALVRRGREASPYPAQAPPTLRGAWVVRPEAAAAVMPGLMALRPSVRIVYDSIDMHYRRPEEPDTR